MLLPLSACSENTAEARVHEFLSRAAEAQRFAAAFTLTADYPDSVFSFSLNAAWTPEEILLEMTAPELLSGLRAHLAPGSDRLEYDGAILDIGELDEAGLSPLSATALLTEGWRSGFLEAYGEQDGKLFLSLVLTDVLTEELWLDGESLVPLSVSLYSSGVCILSGEVTGCVFS